jgi:4-amino-4-deoxy-L-arabinose transferase-like glycosyltransferase
VVAAALLLMIRSPGIVARGEAREALVIRDIVRSGAWLVPRRNGVLASKPPLYHWTAVALSGACPTSSISARLPSALAGIGLVALTLALGRAMGGRRHGWLAVLALLGCFGFWRSASEARVDMMLAACTTASLTGFWMWFRSGSRRARLVCYLGAAAAVLTKGPVGLAIPMLTVVVFLLWQRDRAALARLWSPRLLVLAGAPIVLWYGLAAWAGGSAFVRRQLLHENVDRFLGLGDFARRRAGRPLKILGSFVANLLPWNLVLVPQPAGTTALEGASVRFLQAWVLTTLTLFTVAAGQRGVYLLPLYPAVALLAGRWLALRAPAWLPRLVPALVVFDVAVAAATHHVRSVAADASPLAPFAATVRQHVADDVPLRAGLAVDEGDLIVLAYLLDRPIPRARPGCTAGGAWLVSHADSAVRIPRATVAAAPGGSPVLVVCR